MVSLLLWHAFDIHRFEYIIDFKSVYSENVENKGAEHMVKGIFIVVGLL